ncbi:hypothetical protein QTP70_026755, partial [Hemibagrus guttatus]
MNKRMQCQKDFYPHRPLRCLFSPLSFQDWTIQFTPDRSASEHHSTSATDPEWSYMIVFNLP